MRTSLVPRLCAPLLSLVLGACSTSSENPAPGAAGEDLFLRAPVQMTFPADFVKAGEAYFSPDGAWAIFQAIPVPPEGSEPEGFYSMYVASVSGSPPRFEHATRLSPAGSANTCGWFHPIDPARVLYASTIAPPAEDPASGFQVGTRTYRWQFPREMDLVEQSPFPLTRSIPPRRVRPAENTSPTRLLEWGNYDAEGSWDSTGRFVLFAHVEDQRTLDRADANLYVLDTRTGARHRLVDAPGYDGGPFFSPDGRRICYRSDRAGNDLLQIYVADLAFTPDAEGTAVPTGIAREYQVTDNGQVNWAPFWHPSGNFLIYASSEVGHENYELFAVDVSPATLARGRDAGNGRSVVDAPRRRITTAPGADVLPAFSRDGKRLMWTSQRGGALPGQARASSQIWIADWTGVDPFLPRAEVGTP